MVSTLFYTIVDVVKLPLKVPKNSQKPNYTCLGSIFGTFNGNNGMNGSIPTGERNTDLVQDLLRRYSINSALGLFWDLYE